MGLHHLGIVHAAHHAAEARLAAYASAPSVDVRRADGWFALRTGVDSNDMNGSSARSGPPELVEDLVAWFRAGGVQASSLTSCADPQLTQTCFGCPRHMVLPTNQLIWRLKRVCGGCLVGAGVECQEHSSECAGEEWAACNEEELRR